MSCDDKAKIPVGIPAVHRLNNINHKFFMTGSGPNYPDHDVLRSGSLINPQGYMILRPKSSGQSEQTNVGNDTRTESTNEDEDHPGTIQEGEEDNENLTQPSETYLDDLSANLPRVIPVDDLEFSDEICQVDGADDESSESEEEFDYDNLFRVVQPQRKRARIESDNEDDPNVEESEEEDETNPPQSAPTNDGDRGSNSEDEEFQMPEFPSAKFYTKDGRKHVCIEHTGPTYIFFKSHQSKPSSISRHINDVLTIAEVDKSLAERPNLLLLLDDGLDWGGRALQTLFYFGELWHRLNLDLLVISRNAPGDSKWNPIEQ